MERSGFGLTFWRAAFAVLAALLIVSPAQAQERFSTITGTVTDQSGAPVPGAVVTVTNKDTQRSLILVTRADGGYQARELEPGRYMVKVEAPGFTVTEVSDVNLLLGKS